MALYVDMGDNHQLQNFTLPYFDGIATGSFFHISVFIQVSVNPNHSHKRKYFWKVESEIESVPQIGQVSTIEG